MTQGNQNSQKRLHQSWQRSLPMQGVCWLSSFSLLGNGLVFGQTESAIDNIVPTATTQSVVVNKTSNKNTVITQKSAAPSQGNSKKSNFAQRQARLRQLLKERARNRNSAKPAANVSSSTVTKTTPSKPVSKKKVAQEVIATPAKPAIKPSQSSKVTRGNKPSVRVNSSTNNPKPPNQSNKSSGVSSNQTGKTTPKKQDSNNAYIDPTDYSSATKRNYQASNAVIITERGTGCQAVLAQGQSLNSKVCVAAPVNKPNGQNLANSQNKATATKAPGWLIKSQNYSIAKASPARAKTNNNRNRRRQWSSNRIVAAAVSNRWKQNQTATSVTKISTRTNRFIPSPNNFNPTQVSSTPIAPKGGMLAPPVTADNLVPRTSKVAYDIPLASLLPKIAYGIPNIPYSNGNGFIFPVSVPSPITSFFGWRKHPITGNRRFHTGTDIGAAMGTPILAAETGTVEVADWIGGYGMTVILNHGSTQQTLYGHMSEILVQPGQKVERGMVIGRVGSTGNSTGPHLHFEVRQLTAKGWVATNPNAHLESGLQQLMQSLQTARKSE
ncbi:MAG: peptidoglycan DD-metalloendopeptidase family protein [Richelia sp.]|nr:peptidoglycan DD-metalloendopeptidase family protein [Richelia sp.]